MEKNENLKFIERKLNKKITIEIYWLNHPNIFFVFNLLINLYI
jgi:hypothetical protein